MPDIAKPSDLNKIWSQNGVNTAPTDVKINNGFVVEIPPFEWFNYIENKQDMAIAHINQHGLPVWDSLTEYQAGKSFSMGSNGRVYFCVTTHRNQNPVLDTAETYWIDYHATGYVVLGNASGSWPVPKILSMGIKRAKVTVTAGGGSGGSGTQPVTSTPIRGGGGGAGGTAIAHVNLVGLTAATYNVGAGGAQRNLFNTNGLAGGASNFMSVAAIGGGGGVRYNTNVAPSGGYGGGATGGTVNLKGGDGSDGPFVSNEVGGSGDGGASFWGGGSRGSQSSISTIPVYGAGGGGGTSGGNPGGPGIIIIEW